jgi:hypothetical protein
MTATVADYAKLAKDAYASTPDKRQLPAGWEPIAGLQENTPNGFMARAYKGPDGRVVVAFAGTNDGQGDLRADFNFTKAFTNPDTQWKKEAKAAADWYFDSKGIKDLPGGLAPQFKEALAFVDRVKKAFPNADIDFTGHSLGGGHAQLAAKVFGKDAVTFDAPGAADLSVAPAYVAVAKEFNPRYGINPPAVRPGTVVNYAIDGSAVADERFTARHIGGLEADRIKTPDVLLRKPGVVAGLVDAIKGAALADLVRGRDAELSPYFVDAVAGPHGQDRVVSALQVLQPNIGNTMVDLKLHPEQTLGVARAGR